MPRVHAETVTDGVAADTDSEMNGRHAMQAKFSKQLSAIEFIGLGAAVALIAVVLLALVMIAASAGGSDAAQDAAPHAVQQAGDGTGSVQASSDRVENSAPATAVTTGPLSECGHLGSECLSKRHAPDPRNATHDNPGFIP
jgi:hypothetical protein